MNLFVGNLHPETSAAGLRTLFSQFGEVLSSKVIMDNATGMSRGFGFVEMGDKYHANDAVDNLDQTFFEGNIISVKEAKQSNTRSGGGGGGYRPGGGGGGNRSFKPRTPRPGGWNSDRSGGDRNSSDRSSSHSNSNSNNGNSYNNNRY
jgi:RNA recognition motif-containing protein